MAMKMRYHCHFVEKWGSVVNRSIPSLFLAALFVNGCAFHDGRPAVANYDVESEYKLKSAKHWRVIADDIAASIDKVSKPIGQSVYVPASPSTAFGRIFASQLQSSLQEKGVVVSPIDVGAVKVNITAEEVRHVSRYRYAPGSLTALTAGVMVLRDSALGRYDPAGAVTAVAIGADVAKSFAEANRRPNTEIVLTISMVKDNRYVMHRTDTYYVDDVDTALFTATGRQFQIVGGGEK
jgi:hypothetical protein